MRYLPKSRAVRDSRALTLKKLALRVARRHDREAALVLGDAMMEQGLERIWTGRTRPVKFVVRGVNLEALAGSTAREVPNEIYQPGYEMLYNVDRFARLQNEDAWKRIFSMWITPKRGTYQALLRAGFLPRSIKFHEIEWVSLVREDLGYHLYLVRVPKRRKRPVRTFLLEIMRDDTPATEEQHFDEPRQRSLFGDE